MKYWFLTGFALLLGSPMAATRPLPRWVMTYNIRLDTSVDGLGESLRDIDLMFAIKAFADQPQRHERG